MTDEQADDQQVDEVEPEPDHATFADGTVVRELSYAQFRDSGWRS